MLATYRESVFKASQRVGQARIQRGWCRWRTRTPFRAKFFKKFSQLAKISWGRAQTQIPCAPALLFQILPVGYGKYLGLKLKFNGIEGHVHTHSNMPGKGLNMPQTFPTTNGHHCNIYSLSYSHMPTLTHTCSHSLKHTRPHFFIQHMPTGLFGDPPVGGWLWLMPPVVRRWSDGQTAIGHCSLQRYERLTVCCYLVKGYITLLLCLQNAILI